MMLEEMTLALNGSQQKNGITKVSVWAIYQYRAVTKIKFVDWNY